MTERHGQRVRQAEADIVEVEAQRDAGELDDATADALVARYREEIAPHGQGEGSVPSPASRGRVRAPSPRPPAGGGSSGRCSWSERS